MQITILVALLVLCLRAEALASDGEGPKTQEPLALKVIGDRDAWKLAVELTNVSGEEMEFAELKLPWGYPSSFAVHMHPDPQCPSLKEFTVLENRPQIIRFVVLPHGQTIAGKVDLLERWPALKSRQTICKDQFAWRYSVRPRNSERTIQLSGSVLWKDQQ